MHIFLMFAALLIAAPAASAPIDALREAALKDGIAWDIVEGLTTEVGPRLAGTEAEERARIWAVKKLTALGFSNVRIEPFDMPVWVRGEETGAIVAPYPQPLVLTALGNSPATPDKGLTAEVIGFDSLAAMEDAPNDAVRGRIVFINHRMERTQDGSSYVSFGAIRRLGPSFAARKGAAAIVIRSIGTDRSRLPHTGVQSWAEGVTPIPAAALSVPDAEQLARLIARAEASGDAVRMRLKLTPRMIGMRQSGNVVAEVPGSDPAAGIVLVGGHLDSWDLGTGAIDDAAGLAITTAAAKRVMDAGQPRRTIRVVWFGAEEVGTGGGDTYRALHGKEKHVMAAESDFGADRVWRFDTGVSDPDGVLTKRVAAALLPLGIARGGNVARGGADVAAIIRAGAPAIDLKQDGTRYFDIHHTADDTLDKIDPEQLRQNVAAWTTLIAIVADAEEEWRPRSAE